MAEKEVLKSCLNFLKLNGFYCWRNNTGAFKVGGRFVKFGFPGSSDILGITKDGKFLAVECKREKGGKISDLQKEFLQKITDSGGVAFVVNSLDSLVDELKKHNLIK